MYHRSWENGAAGVPDTVAGTMDLLQPAFATVNFDPLDSFPNQSNARAQDSELCRIRDVRHYPTLLVGWLRGVGILVALAFIRCPARSAEQVKIGIDPGIVQASIPDDFIGFGYETAAVAREGYFSEGNAHLIQLYRTLSPHGLVRIGGNISDHAVFERNGKPLVAQQTGVTVINDAVLVDLGGFLRAVGWKVMWGLNLGTGSKEQAAEEAVAVNAAVGDSLQSFEIGNEVDLLPRFKNDFAAYHAAYGTYKAAVRAALPHAAFSGPDVTSVSNWASPFAAAESADMKLVTQHYYRMSGRRPEATIQTLLLRDRAWDDRLEFLRQVTLRTGHPFRINEVNSFSGGGKLGVSNTFASALWCLDYMFILASKGCAGINVETDVNQFSWVSHYSPIFRDEAGRLSVHPCYYGMLAFAMAGRGDIVKAAVEETDVNLTAYATRDPGGSLWLTIVNKDLSKDANAEISITPGYRVANAFRLTAPSVESTEAVMLAGTQVTAEGRWTPGTPESVAMGDGTARLEVPHCSAALVRISAADIPAR